MVSEVTEGVKVSVLTEYQPNYSNSDKSHFVFTYKIVIENRSSQTVQLLRRYWQVYDSNFKYYEVEGEGVVGQQPVLEPGEIHEYVSGCNLSSGLGKMKGTYLMERLVDGSSFRVVIPEFTLVVPHLLN
jgi:ApaG protein